MVVGLYFDADGDGYGDPTVLQRIVRWQWLCLYGTDCDDTDPNVHPFQEEICDGIDNNWWIIDDGTTFTFADTDGDGRDAASTVDACEVPPGYVTIDGDCDDSDSQYPFAVEICNQEDDTAMAHR